MWERMLFAGIWLMSFALVVGSLRSAGAEDGAVGSRDGIYTQEQATDGKRVYLANCAAECHMSNLQGSGASPALVGQEFMMRWEGMPLAALWERIVTTMPASDPGGLTSGEYLAVLAYLLNQNQTPPGSRRLSQELGTFDSIIIESGKP